eukprot:7727014-Pyramimonas_sp.AAC.2
MAPGHPRPSSGPLNSLWRVQMEHLLLPRELIAAGWTGASSALIGASRGNLLLNMPAQVLGHPSSTATLWW